LRNNLPLRVDLATGELLVELLLKVGVEEVFHSLGGLVQVVGGEVEIGFQERFPQTVGTDDVAGGSAALAGERWAGHSAFEKSLAAQREPGQESNHAARW